MTYNQKTQLIMISSPPDSFVTVGVAWSLLESRRKRIIKAFDGSDSTFPSSETELPLIRSACNLPSRVLVPEKQPMQASGVKEIDLDSDEV